jgi:hypothetical protein
MSKVAGVQFLADGHQITPHDKLSHCTEQAGDFAIDN